MPRKSVAPPPLPTVDTGEEHIVEAELVEEPVDEVELVVRAACELLRGVTALDNNSLLEERMKAIKIVLLKFYQYATSSDEGVELDGITQGIASLFSRELDYAAIQMLYARWGIPEHAPDNGTVHKPFVPALPAATRKLQAVKASIEQETTEYRVVFPDGYTSPAGPDRFA